jgi:5,10-methenyltetrahydrofolate synthetase
MADTMTADELAAWRRAERTALVARRLAVPAAERSRRSARIMAHLEAGLPLLGTGTLGFYSPFRGEPDVREAVLRFREAGATLALPVVVTREAPLVYREWWPGAPMERGALGVPIPAASASVQPDAVLMPPVGFDAQGYRLGYGGGYFDRTLAAARPQPLKIGIAFELSRIATIHPCAHDVPMDLVITERGIHAPGRDGLVRIAPAEAATLAEALRARRRSAADGADATRDYASPPCYAHELDPDR